MFEEIKREVRGSIRPLLGEIVRDAQRLLQQEVELARTEVRGEVNKVKQSVLLSSIGAGFALVSGLLLSAGLVHFIAYLRPEAPLWQSYASVGAGFAIISGMLFMRSSALNKKIRLIPEHTMESLKENAQWIVNQIQ